MTDSAVRTPAATNVVEGFSRRLNVLMDLAGFPSQNRVAIGAKRFGVVHNTFRAWSVADRPPGSHATLLELVEELLKDVPGRHNPRAVVAWLLAGDAVPNPFEDQQTSDLAVVELYFAIDDIAKAHRIDFGSFPREIRDGVLSYARAILPASRLNSHTPVQLDETTRFKVTELLKQLTQPLASNAELAKALVQKQLGSVAVKGARR